MQLLENVLLQVIFLQASIFFVSWLTYARSFRRMPVVGVLLSLANLLSGSGVLLESFHERGNSYLYYQIAD
jgi:hypothetical protein